MGVAQDLLFSHRLAKVIVDDGRTIGFALPTADHVRFPLVLHSAFEKQDDRGVKKGRLSIGIDCMPRRIGKARRPANFHKMVRERCRVGGGKDAQPTRERSLFWPRVTRVVI